MKIRCLDLICDHIFFVSWLTSYLCFLFHLCLLCSMIVFVAATIVVYFAVFDVGDDNCALVLLPPGVMDIVGTIVFYLLMSVFSVF
jgi:hypothetical protein